MNVSTADYGMADWVSRSVEAIALEVVVQLVSRERGEYREARFLLAAIVDSEFQRYRDPFEAECQTGTDGLARWKVGSRLESRWMVPECGGVCCRRAVAR